MAAFIQYSVGLALLPLEPQYGAFVLGHHFLVDHLAVDRLRPPTPGERLFVTAGIAFHTVGVAFADQLYRAFVWYDNVAHLLSSAIVAGLLVALVSRCVDNNRRVALIVFGALLPLGFAWEMYEFHTPHLTVYGWGDAASDIWLNVIGGTAMLGYLSLRNHSPRGRTEALPNGVTNTHVLVSRGLAIASQSPDTAGRREPTESQRRSMAIPQPRTSIR